jgi:hypothetical protein
VGGAPKVQRQTSGFTRARSCGDSDKKHERDSDKKHERDSDKKGESFLRSDTDNYPGGPHKSAGAGAGGGGGGVCSSLENSDTSGCGVVCEQESAAVSSPEDTAADSSCGAAGVTGVTGVISSREWAVECGLYEQVALPPPHLQVKESDMVWEG